MQYSQEYLKTMVYAEFGGQTECIMGNWKIENGQGQGQPSLVLMSRVQRSFKPYQNELNSVKDTREKAKTCNIDLLFIW